MVVVVVDSIVYPMGKTTTSTTTTTTIPHLLWPASLCRDGEGPLDPIEWVLRDQIIRTGCTLAENLIANRGTMHPWCRSEAVDPRPSLGLNATMPRTTASSPNLNNSHQSPQQQLHSNNSIATTP